MLRIEHLNENRVLTLTAGGRLTKEDYEQALPKMEELLEKHGRLRFLIKLENFSGFEPAALWEDLRFDFKHRDEYGKIAIVGDKKWEEWGTKISKPFFESEVKFFEDEDKAEAWVNA